MSMMRFHGRWVVRTFRVANVLCGTMFASLNRTRRRLAANSLQAYLNTGLQIRHFKRVKKVFHFSTPSVASFLCVHLNEFV
jgi:hypothetical protein